MKNKTTLKTLATLCVLALLVSVLPAAAFAEEMIEIPESDYLYVNGDSKVLTAGEEMALLRLVVENPGKVHVLSSGVDITLVVLDETSGEVMGPYMSQNGLMDVPLFAAPGMFLLGVTGNGEVEILAADEERTNESYAGGEAPAEPAVAADGQPADDVAAEPAVEEPAFDASVPVAYQAALSETVSVLAILQAAGAPVEAVTYVSGNVDGRMVSSASSVTLGDWLITPIAYFDSLELTVKTVEDVAYTLVVSCAAPGQEPEPAEAPAEEVAEAPAEEATEAPAEEVAEAPEASAEEVTVQPAEATVEEVAEQPAEATEEETADAPAEEAEEPKEKKGFLGGFVDWLTGTPDKEEEESDEEAEEAPSDETEDAEATEDPAEEATAEEVTVQPAEATVEEAAAEPAEGDDEQPADEAAEAAPAMEVTIAVERKEGSEIRLFTESISEEEAEGCAFQWQYSLDGEEWLDVEGATEKDYTFQLDETNGRYYWRLIVTNN